MYSIQERLGIETESIDGALWQWACMLRSSIPAKVISFDPINQTCIVQIVIMENVLKPPPNAKNGTQNIPVSEAISQLQDVPISMCRVPGWSITFPIISGTECLLIFSDTCIDGWWQSGQVSVQMDRRRHDLSDAIALFGPWSKPNKLSNYSTTSMQIRSDDQSTLIDISPLAIAIKSPVAVNITAPSISIGSSGVKLALMNDTFLQWYTLNILPFLISKGYAGPGLPLGCETTVVKGQ